MRVTSAEWQSGRLDPEALLVAQLNLKVKGYVIIEDVISEAQLKEILGAVAETRGAEPIVVSRRKDGWDEEDDGLAEYL